MNEIKKEYTEELIKRIAAQKDAILEDFQDEPLRSELRNSMISWLAEKMPETPQEELAAKNRRMFILCMGEIVYNEKVRPNLKDFMLTY
jgi:hypothetical protein